MHKIYWIYAWDTGLVWLDPFRHSWVLLAYTWTVSATHIARSWANGRVDRNLDGLEAQAKTSSRALATHLSDIVPVTVSVWNRSQLRLSRGLHSTTSCRAKYNFKRTCGCMCRAAHELIRDRRISEWKINQLRIRCGKSHRQPEVVGSQLRHRCPTPKASRRKKKGQLPLQLTTNLTL